MSSDQAPAHALLSASASAKWLLCPGSVEAERPYPETTSKYAVEGTRAHAVAETILKGHKPTPDTPKAMIEYAHMYVDYVRNLKAMSKAPGFITLIEERLDYSMYAPDGFGTTDALTYCPRTKTLTVVDLKYGKGIKVYAEGNTQLMLYGLAALHRYDDIFEIDWVVLVIVQPRLDHIDEASYTRLDILEFGEEVKVKSALALSPNAPRIPGEKQCQWCRAKADCPELLQFTLDTLGAEFDDETDPPVLDIPPYNMLSQHQQRTVLDNADLIMGFIHAIRALATDCILAGDGFEGYKLVAGRAVRQWADEDGAMAALSEFVPFDKLHKVTLISPAEAEKIGGKAAKPDIAKLVVKKEGKPTLAPESDKRPSISASPDDFDDVNEQDDEF